MEDIRRQNTADMNDKHGLSTPRKPHDDCKQFHQENSTDSQKRLNKGLASNLTQKYVISESFFPLNHLG